MEESSQSGCYLAAQPSPLLGLSWVWQSRLQKSKRCCIQIRLNHSPCAGLIWLWGQHWGTQSLEDSARGWNVRKN